MKAAVSPAEKRRSVRRISVISLPANSAVLGSGGSLPRDEGTSSIGLRGRPQEHGQQIMDFPLVDRVIVVQHHDEVVFDLGQLVDQAAGQHAERGRVMAVSSVCVWRSASGKSSEWQPQSGPGHAEVVNGFVQRKPRAGPLTGAQPGADQDGLAVAGGRRHQVQGTIRGCR